MHRIRLWSTILLVTLSIMSLHMNPITISNSFIHRVGRFMVLILGKLTIRSLLWMINCVRRLYGILVNHVLWMFVFLLELLVLHLLRCVGHHSQWFTGFDLLPHGVGRILSQVWINYRWLVRCVGLYGAARGQLLVHLLVLTSIHSVS